MIARHRAALAFALLPALGACGKDIQLGPGLEIVVDRVVPATLISPLPTFLELPDGRLIVAGDNHKNLTLIDTAGINQGGYDFRTDPDFDEATSLKVSRDGKRLLVLDGRRGLIRVLRIDGASLTPETRIPTNMSGQTMAMCVTGDRIFVVGSRDAADSTVVHEINWKGEVLSSFASPPLAGKREIRGLRLSKFDCRGNRIAIAPPSQSYIMFFDLDGNSAAILGVPHHGDPVYEKSRDPFEPRVRRDESDSWISVHFAPDGRLVAQFQHYAGDGLRHVVTQTLDLERSTWSARSYNVPQIVLLGPRHAYARSFLSYEFRRYRYKGI